MDEQNKPAPGAGNVPIELDGEERVLTPSLRAATTLSRQAGGLMGAVERCGRLDFDTIRSVIGLGLGLTEHGSKDLPEKVYRTGLMALSGPAIRFLHILSNGGRPIDPEEADQDRLGPRTASG
jgi:hypothetical protein